MITLLFLMLVSSPIAFWQFHNWKYRWEIYDGCKSTFWRRLRTDIWLSLPGWRGDIARITWVRGYVRKYAKMEGLHSGITVTGVNERFSHILYEKRYSDYTHIFCPPKREIWIMMVASLVWPLTLVIVLAVVMIRFISISNAI